MWGWKVTFFNNQQARKPRSYASSKLRLTDLLTYLLTRVKSRATSVAKKFSKSMINEVGSIVYSRKILIWRPIGSVLSCQMQSWVSPDIVSQFVTLVALLGQHCTKLHFAAVLHNAREKICKLQQMWLKVNELEFFANIFHLLLWGSEMQWGSSTCFTRKHCVRLIEYMTFWPIYCWVADLMWYQFDGKHSWRSVVL